MIGSQENIMLGLSESPRTAFNTKSIALLLNEKRDDSLTKKLNYYVQKALLLNPRKGIYAKKNYNLEEMAGLVFVPSYISLEYVLQKTGVIFQYDSAITSVSYLSREIEMLGHDVFELGVLFRQPECRQQEAHHATAPDLPIKATDR